MKRKNQNVTIAVLAAGKSSRMEPHNKLLAGFGDKILVRRSVERAIATGEQPVIVVTGHMAREVGDAITGLSIKAVFNPEFATGLSSSLKAAVGAVPQMSKGLLIHLADMPEIETEHHTTLVDKFRETGECAVVRATANGKRGNPVIIPRALFDAICALDRDHQIAGELEGMGLCERKIVRHLRGSFGSGPIPLDGSSKGPATGAITARRSKSGRSLLADPLRVDRGRSGAGPGRHQRERDWFASAGTQFRAWLSYLRQLLAAARGTKVLPF